MTSIVNPAELPENRWPKAIPLLILIGCLTYINCLTKTFTFDDEAWIYGNEDLENPKKFYLTFANRVVVATSILMNHWIARDNPISYRVFNVFIHICTALTIYGLIRRSLLLPRFKNRFFGRAPYLAFGTALLWMVHPIQTQSVTYIIQRCESMAGLFYLLAMYGILRGHTSSPFRRELWHMVSIISVLGGFGSKETMVTFPVAMFLYDRIFLQELGQKKGFWGWWHNQLINPVYQMITQRAGAYVGMTVIVLAIMGINTYRAQAAEGGIGFSETRLTPKLYLYSQAKVIPFYIQQIFWPDKLAIDYQVNWGNATKVLDRVKEEPDGFDSEWYRNLSSDKTTSPYKPSWPIALRLKDTFPESIIVVVLVGVSLLLLCLYPPLGFICFWFFLILAPTSSIMPIIDPIFEHRLYLPILTPAFLVIWLGSSLLRAVRLSQFSPLLLGVLAIALSLRTYLRTEDYATRGKLWQTAVDAMPDAIRSRINAGHGYSVDKNYGKAEEHLKRALELSPYDMQPLVMLGAVYEKLGRYQEAEQLYERYTDYYPKEEEAISLRAYSLQILQRFEQALPWWKKLVEKKPESAATRFYLGCCYHKLNRPKERDAALAEAIRLNPEIASEQLNDVRELIIAQENQEIPERLASAQMRAEVALLLIKPEELTTTQLDTLGLLAAARGDFEKAIEYAKKGLEKSRTGPWHVVHKTRLKNYQEKKRPWEHRGE
jgi:tetratricopeptide (TPR) repeat protein